MSQCSTCQKIRSKSSVFVTVSVLLIPIAIVNCCMPQQITRLPGSINENDILFITVSSGDNKSLQVSWNFTETPKEIKFFTTFPFECDNPDVTFHPNQSEGLFKTNISFLQDSIAEEWWKNSTENPSLATRCLNYYAIAIKKSGNITTCLEIQPTWMRDNGHIIGDIPLTELFIPGTHNSGCFDAENINNFEVLNKYLYNQDRDIWTQLIFGIRYLDFRIAYYNTTYKPDSFWINHDVFNLNSLNEILDDIKLFLNKTDEVVIIDFHRFPVGFKNRTTHRKFFQFLLDEVGHLILPRTFQKNTTLNEIWKQDRRLIISYADRNTAANSEELWDPLNQKWGNKQTVESLKTYLEEIQTNHKPIKTYNPLWASMAELTPNHVSFIFAFLRPPGSLARKVDSVNRNVTDWFRYEFCQTANIVATDHFLGNDIINIAIDCNLKKAKFRQNYENN